MYGIPAAGGGSRPGHLITTEYGPASQASGGPAISLINKGWTGRVRQRTLHGRVLHADVSIASIVEDGRLRGAVSINRDVSSLIEAEAAKVNECRMFVARDDGGVHREDTIIAVNVPGCWGPPRRGGSGGGRDRG